MHNDATAVDRVWFGRGPAASAARLALSPLEALYRVAVHTRGALFDRGILRSAVPPIPAISVGNLSVGGTGKTPMAAWVAAELRARGGRPAVALRGYGEDEPRVHRALNPDIRVYPDPDRLQAARKAAAEGADCLVLDDAFQHRKIARVADLVLVSADAWDGRTRLLPAGPWREPLSALSRASVVVVTRKAVDLSIARSVAAVLARRTPAPVSIVALLPGGLVLGDARQPLSVLRRQRTLAIAAIGNAEAFRRQLEQAGAVVRTAFFEDHHRFTKEEAERLAADLRDGEWAVCTLKDYVKLAPLWPASATAFGYVSQRVVPESGDSALSNAIDSVLHARSHQH